MKGRHASADRRPRTGLTARERQIAGYMARGHSSKLIAYEMGISQSTVSEHGKHAAHKLGLGSRVALVRTLSVLTAAGLDHPPASR